MEKGRGGSSKANDSASKFEIAKFSVEIVGVLLVAASLVFAALALRGAKQALDETDTSRYISTQLNLWTLAAENPKIAPYLVAGKRIADEDAKFSEDDRAARRAGLIAALDFYAYVYVQQVPRDDDNRPFASMLVAGVAPDSVSKNPHRNKIPDGDWESWVTWAHTIVGGFEGAPELCGLLTESELAYEGPFKDAVRQAVPGC
jgi:hypothetical protein